MNFLAPAHLPAHRSLVFIASPGLPPGSSLTQDFSVVPIFKRGGGPAKLPYDVAASDRLASAYVPQIVVVYTSPNDLKTAPRWKKILQI